MCQDTHFSRTRAPTLVVKHSFVLRVSFRKESQFVSVGFHDPLKQTVTDPHRLSHGNSDTNPPSPTSVWRWNFSVNVHRGSGRE